MTCGTVTVDDELITVEVFCLIFSRFTSVFYLGGMYSSVKIFHNGLITILRLEQNMFRYGTNNLAGKSEGNWSGKDIFA